MKVLLHHIGTPVKLMLVAVVTVDLVLVDLVLVLSVAKNLVEYPALLYIDPHQ
jgi:hypothetical protein